MLCQGKTDVGHEWIAAETAEETQRNGAISNEPFVNEQRLQLVTRNILC